MSRKLNSRELDEINDELNALDWTTEDEDSAENCASCLHRRQDPIPGPFIWCELRELTKAGPDNCRQFAALTPKRAR